MCRRSLSGLLALLVIAGSQSWAVPQDAKPAEVVYLTGGLPDDDVAALRASSPNLRLVTASSRADAIKLAPTVDGVDVRFASPEFLRAATKLRWVQATSAGVDRFVTISEIRDNDRIVLTNMQAVHGPTIADHAFAMLLALTRDLPYYLDPENRGTWNRRGSGATTIALQGRTLLVVGLGGIGSEVAKRGKGFGMTVHATRRSRKTPPPYVDRQEQSDKLMELLPQADVVAICLPLTKQTKGLFNDKAFFAMKPGAYLINVGRGKIVDTDALVTALEDGHLAGACLDVTDPEPLPQDHVLWSMRNVVITPHMSGSSALTGERRRAIYLENLRRFAAGETLLNIVNKKAGY